MSQSWKFLLLLVIEWEEDTYEPVLVNWLFFCSKRDPVLGQKQTGR